MPSYSIFEVIDGIIINSVYKSFDIKSAELAAQCKPGMFFQLKADVPSQEKRLFIPISVYGVESDRISFLVKIIGEGTQALADLADGEKVRVIGPLGNGFPLVTKQNVLLVSGGIGYPPLAYLKSVLEPANNVLFHHGGKTDADIFPCDVCYTEDGGDGIQGFVTQDIPNILTIDKINIVFSCGPLLMLKALSATVGKTAHFTSLEAYMACGIGVCYGCSVPVGEGYKRVCADGPVFDASTVRWSEL